MRFAAQPRADAAASFGCWSRRRGELEAPTLVPRHPEVLCLHTGSSVQLTAASVAKDKRGGTWVQQADQQTKSRKIRYDEMRSDQIRSDEVRSDNNVTMRRPLT